MQPWKKHIILATNNAAEGQASRVTTVVAHDFDKNGQMDMDGDGDLDILLAGATSRNIVWYENPLR